jgi:hypothetical protein
VRRPRSTGKEMGASFLSTIWPPSCLKLSIMLVYNDMEQFARPK